MQAPQSRLNCMLSLTKTRVVQHFGPVKCSFQMCHDDKVSSALFSRDGQRVLSVSQITARLWDAATGKPIGQTMQNEDRVFSANFSPYVKLGLKNHKGQYGAAGGRGNRETDRRADEA